MGRSIQWLEGRCWDSMWSSLPPCKSVWPLFNNLYATAAAAGIYRSVQWLEGHCWHPMGSPRPTCKSVWSLLNNLKATAAAAAVGWRNRWGQWRRLRLFSTMSQPLPESVSLPAGSCSGCGRGSSSNRSGVQGNRQDPRTGCQQCHSATGRVGQWHDKQAVATPRFSYGPHHAKSMHCPGARAGRYLDQDRGPAASGAMSPSRDLATVASPLRRRCLTSRCCRRWGCPEIAGSRLPAAQMQISEIKSAGRIAENLSGLHRGLVHPWCALVPLGRSPFCAPA